MLSVVDQWFWFFLLLPAAAASGWLVGRRGGERHSDTQVSRRVGKELCRTGRIEPVAVLIDRDRDH
jgi:lipopolysaccharide biosynthesis regulator YciM